jgi:hypothetical protein
VPEGPPDPAGQHDGAERTVVEGSHGRVSLDVSEWVSELRRLYVEPKTRAARRQEGEIAPQRSKRGRARGRGSARTADLAPEPAAAAAESPDPVAVVAPAAPKDVTPTPPPAIDPTPVVDESEEGYVPPGPTEEETVAAWLTSNLASTGRAVDESAAARGAGERAMSGPKWTTCNAKLPSRRKHHGPVRRLGPRRATSPKGVGAR